MFRALIVAGALPLALLPASSASADVTGHPDAFTVSGPTVVHDPEFSKVKTTVRVLRDPRFGTVVALSVSGLPAHHAGHSLGAHVHEKACGPKPADSGPHHQNPDAPAGTPLHAKEVWLDLKVTKAGTAHAVRPVRWSVGGGSVVIHEHPTDHDTGVAGDRLVCTTVPFTR